MLPWIQQQFAKRKKTAIRMTVFLAAFFLFASIPHVTVHAQDFGVGSVDQNIALGGEDIRIVIGKIIRAVLGLLGIIALVLVLYAGYTIMTAGGDDEKITQGRKILTNAVIGLAIILSSLAIVQFVLSRLADATGFGNSGGNGGQRPTIQNFSGSGSLGKIVKDHYPFRNQKDVSRNSFIAVTFAEPIDPSTIIDNHNGSCWEKDTAVDCTDTDTPKYGDCVEPPAGQTPDLERDCDRLIINDMFGVAITRTDNRNERVAAAALTTYNDNREAEKFLFDPFQPLGDNLQPVSYTVSLTERIEKKNGDRAFPNNASTESYKYWWQFETGTTLDLSPPTVKSVVPTTVKSVVPNKDGKFARNIVVKVVFSEAMNPMTVQGTLNSDSDFTNLIFNRTTVSGEWRVSNGYKTVEFISDAECGQNSCGEILYCLPVVCDAGESGTCVDPYATLIRTAVLDGSGTFQSFPLSGVMDMSGNALDGNKNGAANGKPVVPENEAKSIKEGVDTRAENNDNYFWNYTVEDVINRSTPMVEEISPSVDNQDVPPGAPLTVKFNQTMMDDSLYAIGVEEYRQGGNGVIDPLWFRPTAEDVNGKTFAMLDHREFGPNNQDYYYFTAIPTSVKNSYQNCMYPGRGPKQGALCQPGVDGNGNVIEGQEGNCVAVTLDAETDTGCANTSNVGLAQKDIDECKGKLKAVSGN